MKIPFLALVFQGIPEQVASITLAFVIAGVPIKWKEIIPLGIGLASSAYILRLFPLTFGIHTIILIGLLFIFLIQIYKKPINISILSALITYLLLIAIELFCMSILLSLFQVDMQELMVNVKLRILIAFPQNAILFLVAFIIYRMKGRREMDR